MNKQEERRRGKKTRLRLNAVRKKNVGNKGKSKYLVGDRIRFLNPAQYADMIDMIKDNKPPSRNVNSAETHEGNANTAAVCTISYTERLPEQLNYCASTETNESTKQNTFTHMQILSVEDNKNGEVSFGVENSHEGFDAIPVLSHEGVYTKDLEHNNGMQEANCDLRITSTPYERVRLSDSDLVTPGCSHWSDDQCVNKVEDKNSKTRKSINRTPPESSPIPSTTQQLGSNSNMPSLPKENLTGFRIFDVSHMFNEIKRMSRHSDVFGCDIANMVMIREKRRGMESVFHFVCNMCGFEDRFSSVRQHDDNGHAPMDINSAWVNSMLLTGQGYSQLRDITAALDMPCMSKETYNRHQKKLSSVIHDVAWERMQAAAKEETELALAGGNIDSDGIPMITVIADGAWCKRSFKTNYNALSGVACIIGAQTKKVIFMSVRNRYCCICARSQAKKSMPDEHVCFRNWTKSASAMEADIIVEGFKSSVLMHNLKYNCLIGDGDSSVTRQLAKVQPYGPNICINKVECTNHILRNYLRRLREIAMKSKNSTGSVPVPARTAVASKLLRLRTAVTEAIKYRSSKKGVSHDVAVEELRKDIDNGPYHVFGDHSGCKERGYFCKGQKEGETNFVPNLQILGVWDEIISAKNLVAHHSNSLIHNVTTNAAEGFNSILCKFVGGKRVNFALRGGYQSRSELSVISHNSSGRSLAMIHKKVTGSSPGTFAKKQEQRQERSAEKRRIRKQHVVPKKRRRLNFSQPDKHYGNVQSTELVSDIDEHSFQTKKLEYLNELKKNKSQASKLQQMTTTQKNSALWHNERRKRITASNFGKICRMRKNTPRTKTVISLLYSDFSGTAATRYGIEKEPLAIAQLQEHLKQKIEPTGLIVDADLPWLAATPDGFVGEDAIVEVKCPAKAVSLTPQEATTEKKISFCTLRDGNLYLKENHPYMYQVQGQLHIAKRKYCYFTVWSPRGMSVQKIERQDNFWFEKMEEQLTAFFMQSLLPEIIDPRYTRNMPIREPTDLCSTDISKK